MANNYEGQVAINDIGTQLFHLEVKTEEVTKNEETKTVYVNTFVYGVPVTAGAEFGGDTESTDAPETDLDYVPKIGGRTTLNDIPYTVNYTKEKYARVEEMRRYSSEEGKTDDEQTYMEVLNDGSAMVFNGTSGRPTVTSGDVRQITFTIVPSKMEWVSDIYNLTDEDKKRLDGIGKDLYTDNMINLDADSIPTDRQKYFASQK